MSKSVSYKIVMKLIKIMKLLKSIIKSILHLFLFFLLMRCCHIRYLTFGPNLQKFFEH